MAEVTLTPEAVSRASLAAAYTAIASTDNYKFVNDGKTVLHFKKTGAGAATITVVTPGTVDGQAVADKTFSVPATTGDKFAGPWPRDIYNDSAGKVEFTTSDGVGLTAAVLQIP